MTPRLPLPTRRPLVSSVVLLTVLAVSACGAGDRADDPQDDPADTPLVDAEADLGDDTGPGGAREEPASDEVAGEIAPAPDRAAEPPRDVTFADAGVNGFVPTAEDPLSTFALDVDTASYSLARGWLDDGLVPPADSVRVEEYVNSFDYVYDTPADGLSVSVDGGPSPFDSGDVLVRVGVQAEEVAAGARPPAALTFVVDTSGSMAEDHRLELVKSSLRRLVDGLDGDDRVAVVTYGDDAETVLGPTPADADGVIRDAIDSLRPTGSTNLEAGLVRGYDLAREAFRDDGVNRVVLASDGVANVGLTDPDGLVSLIREDADAGIQLVTVGVGVDTYNDVTMETLADDGDGFYAYVDTEAEADRVFGDELTSTLVTAALDARIQVDFDPATVTAYRLLGFENRAVADEDFFDEDLDAGELGAGHQVTALYELQLVGGATASGDRLGTVQLRWVDPDTGTARETGASMTPRTLATTWATASTDFRLAVTAAATAERLRQSPYAQGVAWASILEEAELLSATRPQAAELADLGRLVADLGGLGAVD